MDPNTVAILAGVISGVLSGGLAALAAVFAYGHGYFRLEDNERRIAKVRLVDDLIAYRFPLRGGSVSELDAHQFNKTMARIPYVFSDNKNVMEAYDEFATNPNETSKLIGLIRACTEAAGIMSGLPDRYVSKTFTIEEK